MRLFIGVDLPVQLKEALVEFQSELRAFGVSGFFKSQDNFHITLEFLGEIDPDKVITLSEVISQVASDCNPFDLNIIGLGAFPSLKRPHTLWTTVNGDLDELHKLRDELHIQLKDRGFRVEERQFKPHITLVSRPNCDNVAMQDALSRKIGEFWVSEIVLFESKAISGKRVYTDVFKARLGT
ncbi:RNA 2',3'-cyclic phosphodiesterase [Desulfosporosinus hippei]|uniref:RNA 2',3'-cyclic phosphodiesterase n=1 Tax=Desulfosporosinus hippei DSM 8344 TaxID=1121419 RepID=A0A1G8HRW6_9FIRM|nr:RNA 2',3'-cyclic phosphodiesterase [Desulfosporosinus hippei]SDI09282.1 2'-5' RNA ligase [Desulfosporosinus hippei DSM 8344]